MKNKILPAAIMSSFMLLAGSVTAQMPVEAVYLQGTQEFSYSSIIQGSKEVNKIGIASSSSISALASKNKDFNKSNQTLAQFPFPFPIPIPGTSPEDIRNYSGCGVGD